MKLAHRIGIVTILLALVLVFAPSSALAIGNPATIDFGTGTTDTYNVFNNVLETGDWLITAEGFVYYATTPTDYTAKEAFLFELLNAAGTAVLASTPLNEYGDRPISIYLTAAQAAAIAPPLAIGQPYGVRITGNPAVFASPVGNTVTAYLNTGDYVGQLLGVDGGVAENNPLRNNMIMMADHIEDYDVPPAGYEYIVTVQGVRYLTILGGDIFMEGIPALSNMCPILFQSALSVVEADVPESTGTYAGTMNPLNKWGATTANGLTMLGVFLGINQALAGSTVLFMLVTMLGFYVYRRTQSGVATLLLVASAPFMGAYMGLMPMALAFIFTIAVIVLMGYFFFSRGAL